MERHQAAPKCSSVFPFGVARALSSEKLMKLILSTASEDRRRSKALRRVRPVFDSLVQQFASTSLQHSIHESILVGIVERPSDYFREIPGNDGYFQINTGYDLTLDPSPESDSQLCREVFHRLRSAVLACPFSIPDRQTVQTLLDEWEQQTLPHE